MNNGTKSRIYLASVLLFVFAIYFKLSHFELAELAYFSAVIFASFVALPVLFYQLYKSKKTGMEIILLYISSVIFLIYSTLRIMHSDLSVYIIWAAIIIFLSYVGIVVARHLKRLI